MHPYLFSGTPFEICSWDFCVIAGFFIASTLLLLMRKRSDYSPVTPLGIIALVTLFLITGSLGAKLLYIALHRETLFKTMGLSFWDAFAGSGYAFLGSLAFELLTLLAFTKLRARRISTLALGDVVLPFIFFHQIFTRIGCFLTGCCYGPPTDMPWGCVFAGEFVKRHPAQLYFIAMLIIIFVASDRLYRSRHPKGAVFFTSLTMYGAMRCVLESWRVDSPHVLGPITLSQVALSVLAVISGLSLCYVYYRRIKSGG
jgi:phosphatidylglycerol:prolipoprotein diacylglycerol transferase